MTKPLIYFHTSFAAFSSFTKYNAVHFWSYLQLLGLRIRKHTGRRSYCTRYVCLWCDINISISHPLTLLCSHWSTHITWRNKNSRRCTFFIIYMLNSMFISFSKTTKFLIDLYFREKIKKIFQQRTKRKEIYHVLY